jgi:imidazolonepropionase-like amidohydrolase
MILSALMLSALPVANLSVAPEEEKNSWTVFAEKVYDAEDGLIENGLIKVQDGKIVSVTPGARPGKNGLSVYAITPGLIDASVRITSGQYSVEQSSEVTPGVRVANSIDPFSLAWDRQVKSGVTTALVCPPDQNVVGGLGVVLKTGGLDWIEARTVKADAVLRGSMGTQPSQRNHPAFGTPTDFFSRRPTTRMGVEWEWRKALYDAAADPDTAPPELTAALAGELPLMIQAWATQDIRTAVFLKEECEREGLGSPRLILDASAEAWREPELLVRSKAAVVLPPFDADGRTTDRAFMTLNCAQVLHEAGVTIALSAHGGSRERQLGLQAGYAMRGGLSFEAALAAVTINPARMLGVDDRVGSLDVGKDADLVLWSGEPFQPTARVVGVLLDGVLEVDPRPTQD